MGFETNLIRGVQNHYGARSTDKKFGGVIPGRGLIKQAVWVFDSDDLPAASTTNKMVLQIPANSIILEAYFHVITAFTGTGTGYNIDLVETDGTANGTGTDKMWDLLTAAETDSSEVAAAMKCSTHGGTNSGNIIGTKLTTAGQLAVDDTGSDFTAGRARIVVEYLSLPAA